ncbi:Uncharacterised protein [Serratia proteamaculans]|uniref:hypothetical protein n=1 Tax=Serratia proteamaculans TaxID=28151 RepID=UPI002182F120|nr:hypothetical protein [Serratia proteamaculans]CAI2428860.1 Uncharacterised protein [Serratia proteamaculans]HEJ7884115.1 hypothetical protein [Serratia liquefaciens]
MGTSLKCLYGFAADLTVGPKWIHGRVFAVLAFDFEKSFGGKYKRELHFLEKYYQNHVSLITGEESGASLRQAGPADKIIIIGHANSSGFGGEGYSRLAEVDGNSRFLRLTPQEQSELIVTRLVWLGLRHTGVIKLHACETGRQTGLFMPALYRQLQKQNIRFSYLSAPTGFYKYNPVVPHYVSESSKGRLGMPVAGDEYTILAGNVPRDFHGTRYVLDNASPVTSL